MRPTTHHISAMPMTKVSGMKIALSRQIERSSSTVCATVPAVAVW